MDNEILVKLNQKIDILNDLEQRCIKGILPDNECSHVAGNILLEITNTLVSNSVTFHINEKFQRDTIWWSPSKNGYANDADLKNIRKIKNHIENLTKELDSPFINSLSNKQQFYFSPGQEFDARRKIFEIMKRSSKKLAIIDSYLDETIFGFIESLEDHIEIQLLTAEHKAIFPKLLTPFKLNRPNIDARKCTNCHDRFLLIDDIEIWQLGSSINQIGKNATMINKVQPFSSQYEKFTNDFKMWWKSGATITS